MTTNATVSSNVNCTSLTEARMVSVRSEMIPTLIADGIEAGWRAVQPFLDAWRNAGATGLTSYKAGSEGPAEADQLLARDGRHWRPIG